MRKRQISATLSPLWRYFRRHENMCCMVFLNDILMNRQILSFNIPFDLIYDKSCSFHAKTTRFCSCNNKFPLTKIFDLLKLSLKINRCEVLVVNALLRLFGNFEDMNYFKVGLRFPNNSIFKKRRFEKRRLVKNNFSWITFLRV